MLIEQYMLTLKIKPLKLLTLSFRFETKQTRYFINWYRELSNSLMVRVDDVGVAQVGSAKTDVQPKSELAKYQNKSYIRNNLLFSQSLSISIPLNTTLLLGLHLILDYLLNKKMETLMGFLR